MRTLIRAFIALALIALGVLAAGADAADKIRVVTTTTDLKALTEAWAAISSRSTRSRAATRTRTTSRCARASW